MRHFEASFEPSDEITSRWCCDTLMKETWMTSNKVFAMQPLTKPMNSSRVNNIRNKQMLNDLRNSYMSKRCETHYFGIPMVPNDDNNSIGNNASKSILDLWSLEPESLDDSSSISPSFSFPPSFSTTDPPFNQVTPTSDSSFLPSSLSYSDLTFTLLLAFNFSNPTLFCAKSL